MGRFGAGARFFHWLVVLLLLVQIPAGIAMIAPGLEQGSIDVLFILHKGLGVVLLVVVAARVLWRPTGPRQCRRPSRSGSDASRRPLTQPSTPF